MTVDSRHGDLYDRKVYSIKLNELIEISNTTDIPFIEYGMAAEQNLNITLSTKREGITKVQLTQKPLKIEVK